MATRQQSNKLSSDGNATLIGQDILVVGRIEGREELKVQGYVEGSVHLTEALIVDKGGVVVAEVRALDVIIYGIVVGDVIADRRIILHPGARVVGDLKAPRVSIAGGAAFRGQVSMGQAADEGQHEESGGHRSGSGRWRGSSRGGGARGMGSRARVSRSVSAKPSGVLARSGRGHELEEPGPRQPPLRKRGGRDSGREVIGRERDIARDTGRDALREQEREVAPKQVPLESLDAEETEDDLIDVDDGMITDGGKKKRAARPRVPARGKHSVDHA